jgi:ADP-heptose:LPS heptosyltransferase
VTARLAAAGIARGSFVAVHPGATAPSRRYPIAHLCEAVAALARDASLPLVVVGGAEDAAAAQALQAAGATLSLAGALDLPELAATLEAARLVLANNSLAAHLAAAVGTPVCDLYALTNPQHTPWRVPHRVLNEDVDCRFCFKSVCPKGHHRCLAGVSPARVIAAVRELAVLPREASANEPPGAIASLSLAA